MTNNPIAVNKYIIKFSVSLPKYAVAPLRAHYVTGHVSKPHCTPASMARSVSRWSPAAKARFPYQATYMEFMVARMALCYVFSPSTAVYAPCPYHSTKPPYSFVSTTLCDFSNLQRRYITHSTHCGRVTQICVCALQLWKTDDAHLLF